MNETLTGFCSVKCRLCLVGAVLGLLLIGDVVAQETDVDPNRVFTTDLRWERVAGAPHSEKRRYANGTLVILYLDGVYAEVTASFIKTNSKLPVGLNLNEGFIVRLGTWSRTEDDVLIHTQSREVAREKMIRKETCQTTTNGQVCSPVPEVVPPGPLMTNTCRLEHPSSTHIADAIVCTGLTVFHPQHAIDPSDFPSMVHHLVKAQESGPKPSTR
jgi:hypothetical protein